jgi:hypothetical protein
VQANFQAVICLGLVDTASQTEAYLHREAAQALELLSRGYVELGETYVFASEQAVPVTLPGISSKSSIDIFEA